MSTTKPAIVVKARLRNFGNGILEIDDETIKFFVETGRLRKHRETIRNIPIAEVESLEQQENDLSITWKENTDVFAVMETSKVQEIHERISEGLKQKEKPVESVAPETPKPIDNTKQLVQEMAYSIEVSNALFNILGQLNGRVNWKLVELAYQQAGEATTNLNSLGTDFTFLELNTISAALQQRNPKDIVDRSLDALKAVYKHFYYDETTPTESSTQNLVNRQDLKVLVQAFYILNDLKLGALVTDTDYEKEAAELPKLFAELAKQPTSKINMDAVKTSYEKLLRKERQKEALEELRAILELRREDLLQLVSNASPETPQPN